jgi:hypothetical protein
MTAELEMTHDDAVTEQAGDAVPQAEQTADAAPQAEQQQSQGPTAAQLRRFIKSRPYVPLHELRRRFELAGELDDVAAVDVPDGRVFMGLPQREADFLAGLVRDGDIGLELSTDPAVPIVVGVFPMRPVTRT